MQGPEEVSPICSNGFITRGVMNYNYITDPVSRYSSFDFMYMKIFIVPMGLWHRK
jgi:hypothetical protein